MDPHKTEQELTSTEGFAGSGAGTSGDGEPGMWSSPLSAVMQSSLVRHICHSAALTYMCLWNSLSASSMANGTSRPSLYLLRAEYGNRNGRVWSVWYCCFFGFGEGGGVGAGVAGCWLVRYCPC